MHKLPEIRIKDGWLLREQASKHLHELWAKEGDVLADDEKMKEVVETYKKAWEPYEKKVLSKMTETLGLSFRQNIIDVYIAPWFFAFSDPMVVGVTYSGDRFVEVLTHELLHRLLSDNNETAYETDHVAAWKKLFGDEHSSTTIVHIPVHAAYERVLELLGESDRVVNDKKLSKKYDGYKQAWEYVEGHGAEKIVAQLRKGLDTKSDD